MSLPSASTQIAVPASSKTDTRLHGRWLLIARIGWIVLAVLAPGLYVAGTFVFSGFLRTICTSTPATCANYGRLTPNDV